MCVSVLRWYWPSEGRPEYIAWNIFTQYKMAEKKNKKQTTTTTNATRRFGFRPLGGGSCFIYEFRTFSYQGNKCQADVLIVGLTNGATRSTPISENEG